MATNPNGKGRTIAIWALRVVLGLLFLFVGITKLTGTANTVEYFAAIGWGQWFRYLTGVLDVVGAVLLFVPRWTCYGAIMLACSVGSAAFISLTVFRGNDAWGGPITVFVPLVLTLLCVLLAWLTRPRRL
jgi:putative oxidoreductase